MTTREGNGGEEAGDFVERLFTASTHDYLMFFTNTGRVYVERVHEIPDMGRAAKGRSIANLLELKNGESIAALIRIVSKAGPSGEDITWSQPGFLFFATQQGTVKKTALSDFGNVRKCASSDVEGSRVGNRKRPTRQKRDTGTNLIAAQMAKIFGRGRDFCQPARCFFQFVTE